MITKVTDPAILNRIYELERKVELLMKAHLKINELNSSGKTINILNNGRGLR